MRRRLALFALFAAVSTAAAQRPVKDEREIRPYSEGPLTEADFRARPPVRDRDNPESLHSAWIRPRLEYKFQTRRRVDRNGVTLTLAMFEAEAAVVRNQSWLREPDGHILAHEQGHFDVMQIIALEWTSQMKSAIAKGNGPSVRRDTLDEANEEMERVIRRQFADRIKQSDVENEYFDTFTRHGAEGDKQTEYRDVQTRKIKELQKQLGRK